MNFATFLVVVHSLLVCKYACFISSEFKVLRLHEKSGLVSHYFNVLLVKLKILLSFGCVEWIGHEPHFLKKVGVYVG